VNLLRQPVPGRALKPGFMLTEMKRPRIPGLPGIEAIITGLSCALFSPTLHDFLLFMKLPGDNYRQYKSKIVNPLADYPVKPNYK